ncbi:hypothetical protein HORIV_15930 [Vreelandella olivaria]|uniref:Major facilitator superfamily (MFS) profile domain-containing protein n=1 Tax=Vreelandella olivaria TaxID=390919 RepID=A0ABM7GFI3_9GAMM|nr:hypothetical protein HORIV_15930 [Halomonas olivaria]
MDIRNKANRIRLFNFSTPQMRAFHFSWFAFHICFWLVRHRPLMAIVREDLSLTQTQIGNTIIASVAITVIVRLAIGVLCDRIGPRKTYTGLLLLGALPVMGIGLADSFETFLLARLAIGAIGASFVITQYHTSMMFASNVVGTANATSAGWGNLGGGTTQILMPLIFSGMLMLGVNEAFGWRLAMMVPGVVMFFTGIGYWFFTQDAPMVISATCALGVNCLKLPAKTVPRKVFSRRQGYPCVGTVRCLRPLLWRGADNQQYCRHLLLR